MKKLLLIFSVLFFFSCNEEEYVEKLLSTESSSVSPRTRAGGDGRYDALGMSYDATVSNLSDLAVRLPVIDLNKIDTNRVVVSTASGSNGGFYYGANSEDYVKEIVEKTGVSLSMSDTIKSGSEGNKKMLFSGTLSQNKNLTSKYSYSSQYSFASHDQVFRIKYIRFNYAIADLKKLLIYTFLEDLDNYTPDQFLEAYGTHLLCDVSIGGRLNLTFRSLIYTESSTSVKQKIVKSGFNAVFPKVLNFSVSGDKDVTVTETDTKKNEDWSLFVQSYGGKAINSIYTPNNGVPAIDLGAWQNSISLKNAALVDIAWDKAIPLYELISDPVKKEQIRQATFRYIEKKRLEMLPVIPVFRSTNQIDHYYSIEYRPTYGGKNEWKYEGVAYAIFCEQVSGTIPFYQYWNGVDHYYETGYHPGGIKGGWKLEGILGYVYPGPVANSVPLYRAWNGADHFYTTEFRPTYGDKNNWKYELISCYVPPLNY